MQQGFHVKTYATRAMLIIAGAAGTGRMRLDSFYLLLEPLLTIITGVRAHYLRACSLSGVRAHFRYWSRWDRARAVGFFLVHGVTGAELPDA